MLKTNASRILLIEGDAKWRRAVETVLERQGTYDVKSMPDVDTALQAFYANGFSLIIINASLALTEKNLPKFREIVSLYPERILVISDVRSLSTAIEVFKLKVDYADKPFEPQRMIDLVSSHIQPKH